ncbi:aryl-sulfate sulfotransferase [Psychroserpens sp.]
MKNFIFNWIILISISLFSQTTTTGLRSYNENVSNGYTLFTPEQNQNVYLIDNCGQLINQWIFDERPGLTCYLLENGNLLRAGRNTIEIRDWDSNIIWSFNLENNGIDNQHHDIEPLPNGNVLCILADDYTDAEMVALGKIPSPNGSTFNLDKIIEIEPSGINGGNIVWEWKFIDHLIQDFDNTKPNFGVVENHPELIDLNYTQINTQDSDYTHVNSIDYNAELDQILLSSRSLNEIHIIDHSTSTIEASGHTGGNSNKGGDILWRWGNPKAYKQGTSINQKLFSQHDAKWVESGYTDDGKITVFNNGGDNTLNSSSIHLITPEIINGDYSISNNIFNPQDYDWSWNGSVLDEIVNESKKSGVHSLPNGNLLFCQTSRGQFTEITKTGENLWTYANPTGLNGTIVNQFDVISNNVNSIFRSEKYPIDYLGFEGKDLTPQGIIENENSISIICENSLSTNSLDFNNLKIINPVENNVILFNKHVIFKNISIIDIHGKTILSVENFDGNQLPINLSPSIYFIKLQNQNTGLIKKVIVK